MSQGTVTIRSINERLEHQRCLGLAGVTRPKLILGPVMIFWVRYRDGTETWEVMGEWEANLIVSDLHNDASTERAAVYHRIPKNAPPDVAARWFRARTGEAIPTPDIINQILAA